MGQTGSYGAGCYTSLVDIPPNIYLIGVKKLHLLSVTFSRDESVTKLLSICPLLEDLVVRRGLYTNVMIFTIDVPTLKSVSIDNSSWMSHLEGVHRFVINAPSLTCFSIEDNFCNYLRFGKMPELVKASVNIKHYAQYNEETDSWSQPSSVPEYLSSHLEIFEWRQYKETDQERR
ncbi:hypothetical protein N665_0195s0004 [Sinapis alba]|nr:hypothetical protein N665_0195s0004 [Sinapis alba]